MAARLLTSAAPVTARAPSPRIAHVDGLDGLRGLALAGVLAFHADGALPGGYLGVDLFFVLSGYLITSLLLREYADTGSIDIYGFWVRRCRRLMPALLSLMPAIAIYGRFFARPEDLQALRNEALASLAYVANWHAIFGDRSYWQLFAAPSPLEHTWSLSIEEQFYIVWPLVTMLVLRKRGPKLLLGVALLLAAASACAMLFYAAGDSSRAYLGTDTRMTPILLGAAFAMCLPPGRQLSPSRVRKLDLIGGLSALVLAVAWWRLGGTDPLLYRGGFWVTELCVLSLIACAVMGRQSLVARALSWRVLRWLGTISYGVYLWHWPVNVFLTSERAHVEGPTLQLVRILLTLGIALVSYYGLERPIRRHGLAFMRPHFTLPATVALTCFLIVRSTAARPGLVASSMPSIDTHASPAVSSDLVRYRILVFGDSTANSLGWGLRALHEKGVEVQLLGKDGCSMLSDNCNGPKWAEQVRELHPEATLVYVGGAFLHGFSVSGQWHTACRADWDAKFERNMTRRLRELGATGERIFAVTVPYPLGHWATPQYRAQVDCINGSLRRAAASVPAVRLVELPDRLCPQGVCRKELPGQGPIRPDGVHFSLAGAQDVGSWVLSRVRRP